MPRKYYIYIDKVIDDIIKTVKKLIKATKNDVIVESEKWNDLLFGEREARLEDIERDFN